MAKKVVKKPVKKEVKKKDTKKVKTSKVQKKAKIADKDCHAYILLDRSYSMSTKWQEATASINKYIEGLPKESKVTLATFDSFQYPAFTNNVINVLPSSSLAGSLSSYGLNTENSSFKFELLAKDLEVSKYVPFDITSITPRGSTPLYDAAVQMMNMILSDKPKKAIFVIMTDGEENCSKESSMKDVKNKMSELEKHGYITVLLGADFQDVAKQGSTIGVSGSNTAFVATRNLVSTMGLTSAKTNSYYDGTLSATQDFYSPEEKQKAAS